MAKLASAQKEQSFLRQNDETLRTRIESLIAVNEKLTKSLRRKVNNRKRRQRNEEKGGDASVLDEEESQLSIVASVRDEPRRLDRSPEQK